MVRELGQVLGIADRASAVRVRNVLSPLLWMCAILAPIGTVGLSFGPEEVRWVFICLLLGPLSASLFAYLFFALKDPQRLQSEEYLLREAQLKILSKHGELTDPKDLTPITIESAGSLREGMDNDA